MELTYLVLAIPGDSGSHLSIKILLVRRSSPKLLLADQLAERQIIVVFIVSE